MKRRDFVKGLAGAALLPAVPGCITGQGSDAGRKDNAGQTGRKGRSEPDGEWAPGREPGQGAPGSDTGGELGWDFDEVLDRSGTWSIKYGRAADGEIPLWIADMDFRTDPVVKKALQERLEQDVMGYTSTPEAFYEAVRGWLERRHGYRPEREWVAYCPGVITSLNQAYLTFTEPGDKIIVQPPVYDHFRLYIERLGRVCVENPLIQQKGQYRMDLEGLERLIDGRTKAIVLCNPQNPIGLVWDRDTLAELARIARRHRLVVFSDEIHADLALDGRRQLPFCSVSEDAAEVGLVFGGPTKAFNLAGLSGTAWCVIPNAEKREKYLNTLRNAKLNEASIPSLVATIAAYTHEPRWLEDLLRYLEGNIGLVCDTLDGRGGIRAVKPEASFLVWLDCRKLPIAPEELADTFRAQTGLILSNGLSYGSGGEGFLRMNVGCPRSVLQEALRRIRAAFDL